MELELKNFCVKFYDEPNVIDNVDFLFDKNAIIFGDEDSGKSTFFKAICGLVKYSGEVLFDRNHINVKDLNISLVLDNPVLFENKTVEYNLNYSQNVLIKNEKQVKKCNIYEKFALDEIKNKKCKDLNLFQKRCVCLARAYQKQPQILFLDCVLDGVAETERNILLKFVLEFKNSLIICTANNKNYYKKLGFKNFVYLKYGKLVEKYGKFDDLFLAKDEGECFGCVLKNEELSFNKRKIKLTKQEVQKVVEECLDVCKLAIIESGEKLFLFDDITGEFLICKNNF